MSIFWKLLGAAAVVGGAAYAGKKFFDKHNVEVNITPAAEEDCADNVSFDDEADILDEDADVFAEAQASSESTYTIGKHVKVRVENPVEMEDFEDVPPEEIKIEFTEVTEVKKEEAETPCEDAEAAEEI